MEARAFYRLSDAPADARDLVPQVAAWLAQVGFQTLTCDPSGLLTTTLDAHWTQGTSFRLLLQASPTEARCHLWSSEQGMCFTWQRIHSLGEMQQLLRTSAWGWVGEPNFLAAPRPATPAPAAS
jgi:hypothetical protein